MKVELVNHGNVFGTGTWFTFYCGNCGRQISAGAKACLYCGEKSGIRRCKKTPNKQRIHNDE